MATSAASRLRHRRPVADPDLREDDVSTAIWDALKPAFYQLEVVQTTRVLPGATKPIRLRHRSNDLIVPACGFLNKIPETRRKSDAILTHHFRQWHRDLSA
jgi:hypothetical protein